MTILVSLPSRPPSPVSSAPAWPRSSVTSVIWCLLRLWSYTVEITVPYRGIADVASGVWQREVSDRGHAGGGVRVCGPGAGRPGPALCWRGGFGAGGGVQPFGGGAGGGGLGSAL